MRATFITAMCMGGAPAAHLLLLCCPGHGNVPMRHLFDRRLFHKVVLALEPEDQPPGEPAAELAARLPPYDVCFNAVADPDLAASFLDDMQALIDALDRPVLNPLARIAATRRDLAPALHAGIADLVVPAVRRLDGAALTALAAASDALAFPLLLRPTGDHGGDDLTLLHTADALRDHAAQAAAESYYLTDFVDYRSADGFFRKYRLVYVDGEVFPYHLAIAREWKVHYWRSAEEMAAQDWMRAGKFAPGCNRLTMINPSSSETNEALTNQPMVFAKIRPSLEPLPMWAMPPTRVANTSGAMIILIRRRNSIAIRFTSAAISARMSGR